MIGKLRLAVGSWSTFGQTALLVIASLFLAQFFAFFLTRNVIDQWQTSNLVEPSIRRFADVAARIAATPAGGRRTVLDKLQRGGERFRLASRPQTGALPQEEREVSAGRALTEALKQRDVTVRTAEVSRSGGFGAMPFAGPRPQPQQERPPEAFERPPPRDEIRLTVQLADGQWLTGEFHRARPYPMLLNPLVLSQIALFVLLLAATLFWASRISRPLRILARAAETLRPQASFEPIPVEGPQEVRVAIGSFNTMAQRVRDLLSEKDRILSAIGHDLRTPLAALRIRAETIEPEAEREKFIETIDEMTQMVEEILALARLGHSTESRQRVDLAALADAVVEEFHSLGKNVTFVEAPRTTVTMQVNLVRRLLRNLIDNAVKYGARGLVSVRSDDGAVELVVEDEGPGIPPERLDEVLQPFTRLDSSRSRLTGGTGLGLSIADAIAKSQGASLILQNRATGGLRVIVRWPTPGTPV